MLLKLLLGGDAMTSHDAHVTGLNDHHIALIESIYESSILQLRLFYKVCMHIAYLTPMTFELTSDLYVSLIDPVTFEHDL